MRFFAMARTRSMRTVVALAAVAGVLAAACGSHTSTPAAGDATNTAQMYRGAVLATPAPKPEFTLTDTSGQPFDFQHQTSGYLTLLYFGYTNCPDVCPLHMANIGAAVKRLPADQAARIKVVFVTTDPARDTATRLRSWLDNFSTSFIGLTGTEEQIDAAEQAAGIPPSEKEDLGNGNYGVSHAAYVIAYTPDNVAHIVYPSGVTLADWTHDLGILAAEGWQA
jgi:protein SCO1/2